MPFKQCHQTNNDYNGKNNISSWIATPTKANEFAFAMTRLRHDHGNNKIPVGSHPTPLFIKGELRQRQRQRGKRH
jgi:hypothetical protein